MLIFRIVTFYCLFHIHMRGKKNLASVFMVCIFAVCSLFVKSLNYPQHCVKKSCQAKQLAEKYIQLVGSWICLIRVIESVSYYYCNLKACLSVQLSVSLESEQYLIVSLSVNRDENCLPNGFLYIDVCREEEVKSMLSCTMGCLKLPGETQLYLGNN